MQTNLLGNFCKLNNQLGKRKNHYWIVQAWVDSQDRVKFLLQHEDDGDLIQVDYAEIIVED